MNAADFLLIDVGNTSAKLRLASAAALLGKTRRLPTGDLLAPDGSGALRRALVGWNYGRVVLSSVVPEASRVVTETLPGVLVVSRKLKTGVDLRGYPGAKTLGADRLANMAGARALHGSRGALIVVDFGTAATFNVLDARGWFLGGVIAPGLASMSGYLPARAAQLPPLGPLREPRSAIGRSTSTAMLAGTVLGYRGLVREILHSLRAEQYGAQVIATGGDAPFVAGLLPALFAAVEPDLTLHGLRVVGGSAA